MQVGDLVELSTYGKKLKSFRGLHDRRGIVIERVHELSRWRIHWFGKPTNIMSRKNIKHVKAKKTLDKTPSV